MVTNKSDAIQFFKILLDWCSPQVARMMLDDMDFYIAETTDNDSVKESIKMVRQYLYDMSMENEMIDAEEEHHKKILEALAKHDGKFIADKPCCRNGCERCEE
jgi:soluble P-type ATPase